MSELALYRKYRSQTFDEVIGQPHVVATLKSALAHNRVSHAYLLTGPRGVGKTSVARLLARAVNCVNDDPAKRPCGQCDICQIPLASNMDIIEIDAASNRRIDEIRDLRDKINLAPTRSRYKVYIIDEVHMLTTEAFNALLKTLEEPPAHAIFILATTEAHKLPETIISRTQRFNFKAIEPGELVSHLTTIAKREQLEIEPAALELIAEAGRGGFRDGISLLDQVANVAGRPIAATAVRDILGLSDHQALERLGEAISNHRPNDALEVVDTLKAQGIQVGQLNLQLVNYFRQILLSKLRGSSDQLAELDAAEIAQIIERLSRISQSPLPEVAFEIALVTLSLPPVSSSPPPTLTSASDPISSAVSLPSETPAAPKAAPAPQSNGSDPLGKALLLVKARNNSLFALLKTCRVEVGDSTVVIACRFSFHRDRLKEAKNREIIESSLAKAYNRPLLISVELEQATGPITVNPAEELVSSALEILGGEIVD